MSRFCATSCSLRVGRSYEMQVVTNWSSREYSREDQFVTTCISYDRPTLNEHDVAQNLDIAAGNRSEERRVGKDRRKTYIRENNNNQRIAKLAVHQSGARM